MQSRFAYIKVFVDAAGHVYVIWRLREHRVVSGQSACVGDARLYSDDELRWIGKTVAGLSRHNPDPVIPQVIRDTKEP